MVELAGDEMCKKYALVNDEAQYCADYTKKDELVEKYFIGSLFDSIKLENFSDFFVEVSFELVTNTNRVHRDVPLGMLKSVKHYNSLGKIIIDPMHSSRLFKEKRFGFL